PYASIESAIEAIASGRPVVVVDDANRENEGDLILAAEKITPEAVAFFLRHTSGVLCVALPGGRCDALQLPPMVARGEESQGTAFTVSVDARRGIATGISASDRAATIRVLASEEARADDLVRPGHVFPLRAREGGVFKRRGHTEASCDLARLAGLGAFARGHALPTLRIDDLVAYRRRTEPLVEKVSGARLPTRHGPFEVTVFRDLIEGREHVALVRGDVRGQENVLVRVHSECLTGDLFGSLRWDGGEQLEGAMARVEQAGKGVVVYLRGHEGRGVGLINKLHAYRLQDEGRDTVEANLAPGLPVDSRRYDVGAQILVSLGLTTIRLMSNNPAKFAALEGYPLRIVERVPLIAETNPENAAYLLTKQHKLGHLLGLAAAAPPLRGEAAAIQRGSAWAGRSFFWRRATRPPRPACSSQIRWRPRQSAPASSPCSSRYATSTPATSSRAARARPASRASSTPWARPRVSCCRRRSTRPPIRVRSRPWSTSSPPTRSSDERPSASRRPNSPPTASTSPRPIARSSRSSGWAGA